MFGGAQKREASSGFEGVIVGLVFKIMVARGKLFAPTHDLARLAQALETTGAVLPVAIDALKRLNPDAVAFRYDDRDIHTVTRDEISPLVDIIANFAKATLSGSG